MLAGTFKKQPWATHVVLSPKSAEQPCFSFSLHLWQGMVARSWCSRSCEHAESFTWLLWLQFCHWVNEPKIDITLVLSLPWHWLHAPVSLPYISADIYLSSGAEWSSSCQLGRKLTPQGKRNIFAGLNHIHKTTTDLNPQMVSYCKLRLLLYLSFCRMSDMFHNHRQIFENMRVSKDLVLQNVFLS